LNILAYFFFIFVPFFWLRPSRISLPTTSQQERKIQMSLYAIVWCYKISFNQESWCFTSPQLRHSYATRWWRGRHLQPCLFQNFYVKWAMNMWVFLVFSWGGTFVNQTNSICLSWRLSRRWKTQSCVLRRPTSVWTQCEDRSYTTVVSV
jgi:hypothetical protein